MVASFGGLYGDCSIVAIVAVVSIAVGYRAALRLARITSQRLIGELRVDGDVVEEQKKHSTVTGTKPRHTSSAPAESRHGLRASRRPDQTARPPG